MMYTDAHYALVAARAALELGPELGALLVIEPWDPGDPWGSLMGARFALNDALGVVGGQTDPTYRAGANPRTVLEEETHGGPELLAALEGGQLDHHAAERADQVLDRLGDRLETDGRSY